MFIALELCLAAICLPLALMFPRIGESWLESIENWGSQFARRKGLVVLLTAVVSLGLRLALLPILPIPQPKVSDEFSYLLLADTFAHGRLSNPPHPMWVHFETFHVNWHPTYASMYYPGYGLFLAFGEVVLGHPFWGVWLSTGLMCAAIVWALQAWMPPGWALVGGMLVIIRLGTFSYWADSYWGGAVAALGGALAFGALPRIRQSQRVRDSLLLALGMALLAYTRPYEGMFFCIPILAALFLWLRPKGRGYRAVAMRVILPTALVMVFAFGILGFYFYHVTGSPFTTPYQVNIRTYGLLYFPWQDVKSVPEFHHAFLRDFYRGGAVLGWYELARHHQVKLQVLKAFVVWLFFFGPILTLSWLTSLLAGKPRKPWKFFSSDFGFMLLLCAITYISCMLTIYLGQPHYVAHLAVVFYAMTLLLMRGLYDSDKPSLKFLARAVPIVCVLLFLARVAAPLAHLNPNPSWNRTWCSQDEQNLARARIMEELGNHPGKHLVIVRYRETHNFIMDEWVYNSANINESKVIWARDMGAQNAELIRYFNDRQVWLAQPDDNPSKLSNYVQ